jgi:hypothetical protein
MIRSCFSKCLIVQFGSIFLLTQTMNNPYFKMLLTTHSLASIGLSLESLNPSILQVCTEMIPSDWTNMIKLVKYNKFAYIFLNGRSGLLKFEFHNYAIFSFQITFLLNILEVSYDSIIVLLEFISTFNKLKKIYHAY